MECFRGRRGWREQQPDTVASVSADTYRTAAGSQRAPWAKVCQTCIDVWERCLGRADGRHYEGLMTVLAREKVYSCVCVFVLLCEVEGVHVQISYRDFGHSDRVATYHYFVYFIISIYIQ